MRRGFTLIELAIVILIISTILGGGLFVLTASVQQAQYNATVSEIDTIEKALLNFAVANGRIPCPSDLATTASSANYGLEAGATTGGTGTGECYTGMTPHSTWPASSAGVEEGGVPTRALQLPDSYMYDAWGKRIRYAVDRNYTLANSLPPSYGASFNPVTSGSITIWDSSDSNTTPRSTTAIYALVSHGPNGHGGYTFNGSAFNAGVTNTDEQKNCHCDNTGASNANPGTYVQKAPILNTASPLTVFDDIVSYKEAWQMRSPVTSTIVPTSVYVANSGASNLLIQSRITGAWSSKTNGWTNAAGVAVDASGNIYVGNTGSAGSSLNKFTNSTGTWGTVAGTTFTGAAGIYVDTSNNIFVVDSGSTVVKKYTAATSTWNTTFITGLTTPYGVTGDAAGNIYVTSGTSVYKFTSAGGAAPGSATYSPPFVAPKGVWIDPGQTSIWVADFGAPSKIWKCTTTCTTAGNWTSSTTNVTGPYGITGDTAGNIWVADTGGNRILEYLANSAVWTVYANYGTGNTAFSSPKGIAVK